MGRNSGEREKTEYEKGKNGQMLVLYKVSRLPDGCTRVLIF